MKTDDEVKSTDKVETPEAKGKKPAAKKPAAKKGAAKKGAAKVKDKAEKPAKADSKKPAAKKTDKPAKTTVERDNFGFRKGSKKSEAAKLYSSKKGATLAEVKEKTGSSQLNLLKELEEKGHKILKEKVKGTGKKQVTRYKIAA